MSYRSYLFIGLLSLLSTGCGETRPSYSMVPVCGRLTLDGAKASGVVVTFDSDSGPRAFGVTDSDGMFQLATKDYGFGAPKGRYKVWIQSTSESAVKIPLGLSEMPVDRVEVTMDGDNIFDFELNSEQSGKPSQVEAVTEEA